MGNDHSDMGNGHSDMDGHTIHISCQSDGWDCDSKDPTEDYIGILLMKKDGAKDWRCNGVHCKAGYIIFLKTSKIEAKFKATGMTRHQSVYHHVFGELPKGIVGQGFSYRPGYEWFGKSASFNQIEHPFDVEMPDDQLQGVVKALRSWNTTGCQNHPRV